MSATAGHPWTLPGTPSGLDLEPVIHKYFSFGRQLRAVVPMSPSVDFSLGIFMALPGLGANVRTKECGCRCPPCAHRERRVDCAANGLSSFRNHHDVESEC